MYPVFTDNLYFNTIIDSLINCRNNKELNIHGYVIMIDHVHLILSENGNKSLSGIFRDLKRHTSNEISALLNEDNQTHALRIFQEAASSKYNQTYKVWETGFHPIGLQSEYFFIQKLNYIHENPVRKGYVDKPEHWVYSSAGNYAGYSELPLKIDILAY
jgi:REP element-mobilizing transposase RayT